MRYVKGTLDSVTKLDWLIIGKDTIIHCRFNKFTIDEYLGGLNPLWEWTEIEYNRSMDAIAKLYGIYEVL